MDYDRIGNNISEHGYSFDPALIPRECTPELEISLVEDKKSNIDFGSKWLPITVDDDNDDENPNNLHLQTVETSVQTKTLFNNIETETISKSRGSLSDDDVISCRGLKHKSTISENLSQSQSQNSEKSRKRKARSSKGKSINQKRNCTSDGLKTQVKNSRSHSHNDHDYCRKYHTHDIGLEDIDFAYNENEESNKKPICC